MNGRSMRRLALTLGVCLAFGSCGSTTKPCTASTCMGCCDESGECVDGTAVFECGLGGASCKACPSNQFCNAGACELFDDGGDYDAEFDPDPDGNYNLDAGVYDASVPDAGPDAGRADSGTPDAGRPPDAGTPDAGRPDAGRPDAGFDAGTIDAGVDAGADAGDGG